MNTAESAWRLDTAASLATSHPLLTLSLSPPFLPSFPLLSSSQAEEDVMCGLWRRRCSSDLTRACLTLVQAGQWERSEELLGEAVRQGQLGVAQVRELHSAALWWSEAP